ncbi:MAG: hypothetical protein HQL20_02315 [Candidatus Omnitrophica bacterium]|nr:hypothetical protein [Candidatus Omnitrophota bacterium]
MVEVIVAAVIFTVSIACIFGAVRSLAQQPVSKSAEDTRCVQYGQRFLASLRNEVDAGTWGAGPIALGNGQPLPVDLDFPGCSGTYNVVSDANGSRRVILNIAWP